MANTTTTYLTFTSDDPLTNNNFVETEPVPISFDSPSIGNILGTRNDVPAIIGNTASGLVGNTGMITVRDVGLNLANATSNTTILVPNTVQIANTSYFLTAGGTWELPFANGGIDGGTINGGTF